LLIQGYLIAKELNNSEDFDSKLEFWATQLSEIYCIPELRKISQALIPLQVIQYTL